MARYMRDKADHKGASLRHNDNVGVVEITDDEMSKIIARSKKTVGVRDSVSMDTVAGMARERFMAARYI